MPNRDYVYAALLSSIVGLLFTISWRLADIKEAIEMTQEKQYRQEMIQEMERLIDKVLYEELNAEGSI